ncbi:MAG TPA: DUF2059 domain-containing protein [Rhizomicrobium sp.]|jgi:hypothetical protein|nr:DUF2059 domain-containing protein [Rhizomicrobium sp.]
MTRIDRNFAILAIAFCMTLGAAANAPAAPAAPAPAPAAAPAAPDDPAKIAAAREFIILAHPRTDPKNIAANIDKVIPRLVASAKKNDPKLDAKAYESQTRARMLSTAATRLDLESQIVSRHFTIEELKAFSAFYASPTGRRLTDETPKIQAEMMHVKMPNAAEPGQAITVKSPPPHK